MSPLAHIRKHDLVVGDASTTFPRWLTEHPEQLVALVILDMDVYQATADVLTAVRAELDLLGEGRLAVVTARGAAETLRAQLVAALPGGARVEIEAIALRPE